jgi:tyrosine-protein kinase Etk/Wzc
MKKSSLVITWGDVAALCRRARSKILTITLLLGLTAALFALSRPVEYKAEATFREKSKSQADTARSFSLALLEGIAESNENTAVTTLKSRSLLEKAIAERHLQVQIEPDRFFNLDFLQHIVDHLKVEYALGRKWLVPIVNETLPPLRATEVVYGEEIPLILHLTFTSPENFQVNGKGFNSEGTLGEVLLGPGFALKLERQGIAALQNQRFKVTVFPLPVAVERARKKLTVDTDLEDKGMLNLSFKHPQRKEASAFLNTLLAVYQEHLKSEHQRICGDQIAYLNQRQQEAAQVLKNLMEKHAETLSKNMVTLDLLVENQKMYAQKLLSIDLELSRLENLQKQGPAFYERLSWDGGEMAFVNQALKDIRSYRQQSDSIDIALKNRPGLDRTLQTQQFEQLLKELEEVRAYAREARTLHTAIQEGTSLPKAEKLAENTKYLVRDWQQVLHDQMRAYREAVGEKKEALRATFNCCVSNYGSYLGHVVHLLDVEEKLIQERLTHQQLGFQEFQGIDLATAQQLYLDYSKKVHELEADSAHQGFLLKQMQDPHFELSALSTVLQDPISRDSVSKASQLTLQLNDEDNRSAREIERLQAELALQRTFLSQHLEQAQRLIDLRRGLLQEKIAALQKTTLELIQQMVSVLHQQIEDYIASRRDNLQQERLSIEKQQRFLQEEMGLLPEKWASERLIEQHVEMTKKMIEKITEAVETKNIASNLDISKSAPIDKAIPPLHPQRSLFLLLTLVGATLGALGTIAWLFIQSLSEGVRASAENLQALNRTVIGFLGKTVDLDILRRIATPLLPYPRVLLMTSQGVDYSAELAALLGKGGRKILLLPLSFDRPQSNPGLKEYLEGKSEQLPILPFAGYDLLEAGGETLYGNELISTPRFQSLLDKLQAQYECILLVSHAPPSSAEGLRALYLAPCAVVTVTNEKLEDLLSSPPSTHVLYIIQKM